MSKQLTELQWRLVRHMIKLARDNEFRVSATELVDVLYEHRRKAPKNARNCVMIMMRRLSKKLRKHRIFLDRVTELGRGKEATFGFNRTIWEAETLYNAWPDWDDTANQPKEKVNV